MSSGVYRSVLSSRPGNLTPRERWISSLAGLGLALGALPRGGLLRRLVLSSGGLTLMARGLGGYCAVKAALTGQATLAEGAREQWQRVRGQLGVGAGSIDSMRALYIEAFQELVSSAEQLLQLLGDLQDLEYGIEHPELLRELRGYATQIRSRRDDLERLLTGSGATGRGHSDQAMQALVEETRKMCQVVRPTVRDVALVDSLQRIIHYQIAAYGSVAAYAKALGRDEEASRLAEYSDRDKSIDAELTELAKELLNPRAAAADHRPSPPAEARTH